VTLLRTIRTKRPGSIYELAKIVGRDLKNVQDDLRLLERYGLVRMSRGRSSGRREVKIPQAVFHEIALKIAI
jgi:predicted transcriptional regulator